LSRNALNSGLSLGMGDVANTAAARDDLRSNNRLARAVATAERRPSRYPRQRPTLRFPSGPVRAISLLSLCGCCNGADLGRVGPAVRRSLPSAVLDDQLVLVGRVVRRSEIASRNLDSAGMW